MSNEDGKLSITGRPEAIQRMLDGVERKLSAGGPELPAAQAALLLAVRSPEWTQEGVIVRIDHEEGAYLAKSLMDVARNQGLGVQSAPVSTLAEHEQYTYYDVSALYNGANLDDGTWGELIAVAPGEAPEEVAKDLMCEREPHIDRDAIVITDCQEVSEAVSAIVRQLPEGAGARLLVKLLDRDYRDRINDYVVLFRTPDMAPADAPRAYVCRALDGDHAEERTLDHHPDADVVWVVQGVRSAAAAYADYYAGEPLAAEHSATVEGQHHARHSVLGLLALGHQPALELIGQVLSHIEAEKRLYAAKEGLYFEPEDGTPAMMSIPDMIASLDANCENAMISDAVDWRSHHTYRVALTLLASLDRLGVEIKEPAALTADHGATARAASDTSTPRP